MEVLAISFRGKLIDKPPSRQSVSNSLQKMKHKRKTCRALSPIKQMPDIGTAKTFAKHATFNESGTLKGTDSFICSALSRIYFSVGLSFTIFFSFHFSEGYLHWN